MRGISLGVVVACCAVLLGAQSTFGDTNEIEIVKLKANYDFGNYKLGAYNKRTILGCAIDGNQDFPHTWKWFHGDDEIKMDDVVPHEYILSRNMLVISYLNESTIGPYTCKLYNSNNAEQLIADLDFNVAMKPALELKNVQTFSVGDSVSMKCSVHGAPVPEITWKYGNAEIVPSENVSITTDNEGNSILQIKSVDNRHKGRYYCNGHYSIILPDVESDSCILFNEEDLERFVKTTSLFEQRWADALLTAFQAEVKLQAVKSRFINALLWLKITGRWTTADERWIEPFRQNMLANDLAVVAAKAEMLAASRRAEEIRQRNADPNVGEFSARDEVEAVAAAAHLAERLDLALADEATDIKWLMSAVEYRAANRVTYIKISVEQQ